MVPPGAPALRARPVVTVDVGGAVVAGLLAGWAIAVPVGAVAVLLVMLGAHHGRRVGCAGGLGAAVVDGVYASVAVLLGSAFAPLLLRAAGPVRWVSAAALVVVALVLLRPALTRSPGRADRGGAGAGDHAGTATGEQVGAGDGVVTADRLASDDAAARAAGPGMTPRRAFVLVLAATALNPATVVYFVALTSGASATTLTDGPARVAFVLAAFGASASWQVLLGSAGAWAGSRLTGPRGRRWTAVVGAVVVLLLAARTALAG